MEYHKILNLLDNTPNQPSKFKTKNCVEIKIRKERIPPIVKLILKLRC